MKKIIIIFLFILILLISINMTLYGEEIIYTVKAGDSLYLISRQYGITIRKLKTTNNLDSNMIYVGQKLTIITDNSESSVYTVKAGDSLYKLAQKYNTTIARIMEINNLDSYWIYIDQQLKIPGKEEKKEIDNSIDKEGISISGQVSINNKTENVRINKEKTINTEMVSSLNVNKDTPRYLSSEIIIKYKPVVSEQALLDFEKENNIEVMNVLEINKGRVVKYKLPEDKKIADVISSYQEKENVVWAEPNYIYYPTAIPNDSYYNNQQWNYVNMNMEAAWDLEKGGDKVTVAVLDTGIIPDHPDLKNKLLPGADLVGGEKSYPVSDYEITDNDPTDETSLLEGGSHGTHVAGIIGAETDNYKGIAGINWKVDILPVRVLTRQGGTSWDIAEGLYYAIDKGADVINLSLGGPYYSNLKKEAIRTALDMGITIVAAAGNEGNSSVFYPAAFDEVIAVSAVNRGNNRTAYSNYGPEIDIAAPGGGYGESIYSTWGYFDKGNTTASYGGMIGTSMATPHVSGVVALLKASGIKNRKEILERLRNTAVDLGEAGKDYYYGYGLVDAYSALLGHKLAKPKVAAAVKKENDLIFKSQLISVDENGNYTLNNIKTDNIKIIAWRDVNDNDRIDRGDYYGESRFISTEERKISNLDIKMYYISNREITVHYQ